MPKATQRTPKSPSIPFELRPSPIQGLGAFATRPIRKGTRIIEYLGERITDEEADKRYDDLGMDRHHTFLFSLGDGTSIDASESGNEARFINHACEPNCEAVLEDGRIFIDAIRDIQAGEELLYDYAYERQDGGGEDEEQLAKHYFCACGTPACRGTILAPRPAEKDTKPEKPRAKRGKRADTASRPRGRRSALSGAPTKA